MGNMARNLLITPSCSMATHSLISLVSCHDNLCGLTNCGFDNKLRQSGCFVVFFVANKSLAFVTNKKDGLLPPLPAQPIGGRDDEADDL